MDFNKKLMEKKVITTLSRVFQGNNSRKGEPTKLNEKLTARSKKSIKKLIRLIVSVAVAIIIFVFSGLLSWLLKGALDWVTLAVNVLFFAGMVFLLYNNSRVKIGNETSCSTGEKISLFLADRYSLFHADLILRAMTDDSIDNDTFMRGIYLIDESFRNMEDNDEYVPDGWENV